MSTTDAAGLVRLAAQIADEVLWPAASEVDRRAQVPSSHLDLLAASGLYGIFAPRGHGGLVEADPVAAYRIVEELAAGCLSTAFVWVQHHGAVRAVANSDFAGVRRRWLTPLRGGSVRAGLVLGGVRPGPPSLRVRRSGRGYALEGESPWVTGWGLVDVLLVAARDAGDVITWLLVDAQEGPSLTVTPLELSAVMASRTVTVHFDSHVVGAGRRIGTLHYSEWPARDAAGLRMNGSLALGVASRSRRLIADGAGVDEGATLGADLEASRAALDQAGVAALPAARAAAAALCLRAAAAAMVSAGARGILAGEPAQRLLREAGFLLVFGSRPAIRAQLLGRVTHTAGG